jgi:hypothetical protein
LEIVKKFIDVVESLGYPVIMQGTLSGDYEKSFFTWWNNESVGEAHYDNAEQSTVYDFDLNAYSSAPLVPYEMLKRAKEALKSAGFIVSGNGYTVASDEPTHTGRGLNIIFVDWSE